jgi:endoglucanase
VLPRFSGPATISTAMDDLERALDRLLGMGYSVTVDLHPGGEFNALHQRDHESVHRALLEVWPILAKRIGQWPHERVFAELLNEPATTDGVWRPFVETLANSVRAILPKTFILVGPAPFHHIDALAHWRPLVDDRIVYVCHYYDPMLFTHQGATWDKSVPWGRCSGVPFPAAAGDATLLALAADAEKKSDAALADELRRMATRAWNAGSISAQFAELGRWSAEHSAPVVVNEFGVLKWKAKRADRLAWLAATRAAIEAQGFGWAHWDYDTAFGLIDDAGEIDQGVILALFAEKTRSTAPSVKATRPITTGKDRGTK